EDPIPYIPFKPSYEYPQKLVQKNLKDCLRRADYTSRPLETFIDWILWGFNNGETFPDIKEDIDDYWYRTFNLGLFYKEPSDHWAEVASEYMGKNNGLGYFPTPGNVVEFMVKINIGDKPLHKHKRMSVCDPCLGTGVMLLYASNYSLNLYGNDISLLLTKIARINAF
ncbi:MAG: SAM-dependent DNA methyltransferase, partial [Gammaproteobacteria bacterium]|nr:SAM-dependent DNA methyltransferase [Gammaproteobacteria bacterium]